MNNFNWTIEHEAGQVEYEAQQEYNEWLAEVEATIPPEEPTAEVDAWGLPCRPTDDCTVENWNPSSAEINQYWNNFWNGLKARMHEGE